ncbi:CHAD domain-containing protein [uncultured Draconibacterium sp.]|uniref:CHAD domain-containing protein n=1 Tax=uncultured Draconibacterium sp. TaxID=1573823 RepID=UPI003216D066
MENSILLQHFNSKLNLFQHFFRKTLETQEMEDIHELRVNIKKLRTICTLIQEASFEKLKKEPCFELFSNLFRVAGMLREAQINLEIIENKQFDFLIPFVQYLKNSQDKYSKQLLETMLVFDQEKLQVLNNDLIRNVQNLSNDLVLKESVNLAIQKTLNVIQLKDTLQAKNNLHQIRIQQKAVHELLGIIVELHPDSTLDKLKNEIKLFNIEIGNWHDYKVLHQALNEFTDKNQDTINVRYFNSLIEGIEKEQELKQTRLFDILNKHMVRQQLNLIQNLLN